MIRFVDSFDYYDTADILKKWSSKSNDSAGNGPTLTSGTGRYGSGTQALYLGAFGTAGVAKTLENQTTWITGFAFKYTSVGTSNFGSILSFIDSHNLIQGVFNLNSGTITYVNGSRASYSQSATSTLTPDVWNYIEFKIKFSAACAAGDVQVMLNGVSILSIIAGVNTIGDAVNVSDVQALTIKYFGSSVSTAGTGANAYIDDLYICDSNGPVNTSFLGDCVIETLYPTGPGSNTQWGPLSGANYTQVQETFEDGDTSYVKSNTVTQVDTYAMSDLSTTFADIRAVQISAVARKDDIGPRLIATAIKSGDTTYDHGTTNPIGLADSYIENLDIWESDPNGNIAWTSDSINAMEVGVKLVS